MAEREQEEIESDLHQETSPLGEPDPKEGPQAWVQLLQQEELIVLCIYPLTVMLGQFVGVANPQETYFANKHNVFNTLFVRKGWFWTTLAFLPNAVLMVRTFGTAESRKVLIRQQVIRYLIATVWFVLFAQWCFGLPLMDRVFVWTGGKCEGAVGVTQDLIDSHKVSSAMCRQYGGLWTGGYDPSGHSFLLAHSSLFLWFEVLPLLMYFNRQNKPWPLTIRFTLALLVLWWWMLLMTSMYFHSFVEKFAGLLWGLAEIVCIYVYSRRNGHLASIVGVTHLLGRE